MTSCASRLTWSLSRARRIGNGSSLLWGSCYSDAPKIFLSEDQLSQDRGERAAQMALRAGHQSVEGRAAARRAADSRCSRIADKTLWTDRPLTI